MGAGALVSAVVFLGTSDEVQQCECCGRKDLKSTVALSIDDGDAVYFGVVCAARALRLSARDVRSGARRVDDAKRAAAEAARRAAHEAECAPWFAFLAAHGTGGDTFRRIESLGGYKAARAMFEQTKAVA